MTSMPKVFKLEDLKAKNIVFGELKKFGPATSSYINYKSGGKLHRLLVMSPKMFAPFGASTFEKEKLGAGQLPKYDVRLSLDYSQNEMIKVLRNFLEELDATVCAHTRKSPDWIKNLGLPDNSEVLVKHVYKPTVLVQKHKDGKPPPKEYPPMFKLKVPMKKDGTIAANIASNSSSDNKLKITTDNIEQVIPKLTELKAVFQISHVWFVDGKFGITIQLVQARTYPKMIVQDMSNMFDEEEDAEIVEHRKSDPVTEEQEDDIQESDVEADE